MKQLMCGDASVLVGDAIAEVLFGYAAQAARSEAGESVEVRTVARDGQEVMVTLWLGAGAPGVDVEAVETSLMQLTEPDNAELEVRLRAEMVRRQPVWMGGPDPLEDPWVIATADSWARRHRA
jgi:hypothetical protein